MSELNNRIVIADWTGSSPHNLNSLASRFAAQISAIAEISETVIPELESKERKHMDELRKSISRHLKKEEEDSFQEGFEKLANELTNKNRSRSLTLDMPPAAGLALAHFIQTATRHVHAGSREDVMRRALIVSLVSNFEILFGRLARAVYEKNQAALNDSDYAFTIQQMANFESIQDARDFLIDRRLSALLRDGIDGWNKWLSRACGGLSMTALSVNWPGIRELFARRNLIVHAEAEVNQIYLDAIKGLGLPGTSVPEMGETLTVSSEYLLESAEQITALGVILTSEVARKLHKRDFESVMNMLIGEAEECARRGYWKASLGISSHALTCPSSRRQRVEIQTFNWLARRAVNGKESIQAEVEAWDTSGLTQSLTLRKKILLDPESAVGDIEKLLSSGELTAFELAQNPLYEGVLGLIAERKEIAHTVTRTDDGAWNADGGPPQELAAE
ncbi:hypothetical protein ACFYMI_07490 [Streptomyces collinus]|uniref:hypothetical protein n=1 Tax=Streptomyces collinus TaxID=42684 RepID=UPI0036C885D9